MSHAVGHTLLVETGRVPVFGKNNLVPSTKIKKHISFDLTILFLGHHSMEMKALAPKDLYVQRCVLKH